MYVTSCTKQESGESKTNIECISVNNSEVTPVNLNYFVTPKTYAKWGNMPSGKHMKTSNHFEPLSNFNDTSNGNRNNNKRKPAEFEEDEIVKQRTSRNKHSKELPKCLSLQHNLRDINSSCSQPNKVINSFIPTLINGQITLRNNHGTKATGKVTLNESVSGSKTLMDTQQLSNKK
jgi:hypothetical protein